MSGRIAKLSPWRRRLSHIIATTGPFFRSGPVLTLLVLSACANPPVDLEAESLPTVVGEDGELSDKQVARVVTDVIEDAPDPDATLTLLSTIESLSGAPLYDGNRATLLIDGPATYQAMLEAIAQAQQYVHIETYIFSDDQIGRKIADALLARRQDGVDVRVIFDSFGSRKSDDDFFSELIASGIEVIEFNPIVDSNPLDANNRDHRKLLIVDGKIAFTGGINFHHLYARASDDGPRPDPLAAGWRDTHIAIEGPAATAFDRIFMENWRAEGGENPDTTSGNESPEEVGNDVVAALQAKGGDEEKSAIFAAYLEAMSLARERIWITQAYFSPDEEFTDLLKSAARRGVDVQIIVPGFSDTNVVVHASRSRYGDMLKHGIKLYETTTTVLHAKTAVIDSIWSTVGSSNLDYRSFLHNDEVNAVIFGAEFAATMEAQFLADAEVAEPVSLAAWENRPLRQRVKEFFSWTMEYWL